MAHPDNTAQVAPADATGSCIPRIRTLLKHGSKSEAAIARLILESPTRARDMSIGELAQACGTSLATVSRFCREIGYSSYREFLLDLAAAVAQKPGVRLDDFPQSTSSETVIRQVFECHRQSLLDTERMLDHQVLIEVARLMRRKRRILLMGIGGSSLPARHCAERLLSLGFTAIALDDPYLQIFGTANTDQRDVVLGISHTGENVHVIEAIRTAREKGAITVAVTNYPQSPLALASQYCLLTAYPTERADAAISSSIVEQLCMMEALYFLLGSWAGDDARRLAEQSERRTQKAVRKIGG